ncbi:MAG: hypothetical protein ACR2IL_02120 [Chitinophagaceae bacterium]
MNQANAQSSILRLSNWHILLWLFKDACWVSNWKLLGTMMIAPTLGMAIYITYRFWHMLEERFHNLGVFCWICANAIWMLGEFFYNDGFRPYAQGFFFAGLGIVVYYYLFVSRKAGTNNEH